MSLKLITPPVYEPVSLDEAKAWVRVDSDDDDASIAALIVAAREACEIYQSISYTPQTWLLALDEFPGQYSAQTQRGAASPAGSSVYNREPIILPRRPLRSINSVKYIDQTGSLLTLDPSRYQVDTISPIARIAPGPGQYWPISRWQQLNAVQIEFEAGFDPEGSPVVPIPKRIIQGILAAVNYLYERPEVLQLPAGQVADLLPAHVKALLGTWEV